MIIIWSFEVLAAAEPPDSMAISTKKTAHPIVAWAVGGESTYLSAR